MEQQDLILKTIDDFHKSEITLVEWETPLLARLGYPLAPKAVCSPRVMPQLMFLADLS
jgi:hypothetical protein